MPSLSGLTKLILIHSCYKLWHRNDFLTREGVYDIKRKREGLKRVVNYVCKYKQRKWFGMNYIKLRTEIFSGRGDCVCGSCRIPGGAGGWAQPRGQSTTLTWWSPSQDGHAGWGVLPWLAALHAYPVLSHHFREELMLSETPRGRTARSSHVELSGTLPPALVTVDDFNLCPLAVITRVRQLSVSSVCLPGRLLTLRLVLRPSELEVGIRREGGLVDCTLSGCIYCFNNQNCGDQNVD